MRYCVVAVFCSFGAGIALGLALSDDVPSLIPLTLSAIVTLAALAARNEMLRRWLVLLAVCGLGLARAAAVDPFPLWSKLRAQGLQEVTGSVTSYPSLGEDHITFTLRVDALPGALRVTWFLPEESVRSVHYGNRLTLVGSVRLPEAFDGFDYPAYLAGRGILATMLVGEDGLLTETGVSGSPILQLGDRVRQSALRSLRIALNGAEIGLAQGLLFGDRAALSEEIEEAFRKTGLMHVLAVSGLHLGIVLAAVWFVLRRTGVRPAIAYPIVGVLVLLVLWIVGPRISLVRASLLFAFLALGSVFADFGWILRRSVRPMNGLAAAAVIILALRPTDLTDAGFQLTFAATAGILIVVSPTVRARWEASVERIARRSGALAPLTRHALTAILISAAAQAAVVPVVAWHFGTFHPLLVALNLIVVPLVTIALWVGLPGILLTSLGARVFCALPFGWALRGLSGAVEAFARIPFVEFTVPPNFGLWTAALVGFLLLAVHYSSDSSS